MLRVFTRGVVDARGLKGLSAVASQPLESSLSGVRASATDTHPARAKQGWGIPLITTVSLTVSLTVVSHKFTNNLILLVH